MSFSVSFAMSWAPQPVWAAACRSAYEGSRARSPPPARRFFALCDLGRLHLPVVARRGLRAGPEVGRAGDRAVEARPALAARQRLLDPVERAEPPAEVVDHVDEGRL